MAESNNHHVAAPCGIYCGECVMYRAKDNPAILEALLAKGYKQESVPCPGCRAVDGNCPVIKDKCATYVCTIERKVDFCFECSDFPCANLNPAADMASTIPHNLKIFNLCFIKEQGLGKWLEQASDIHRKYFHGKMIIGKGPEM